MELCVCALRNISRHDELRFAPVLQLYTTSGHLVPATLASVRQLYGALPFDMPLTPHGSGTGDLKMLVERITNKCGGFHSRSKSGTCRWRAGTSPGN